MYNALDENAVLEGVKRFGPAPGARKMMDAEMQHAMEAIESGTYITYWFEKKKSECGRLGSTSKCFCGHYMSSHNDKYFGKKFDVACKECPCKTYKFVPTRPEECGMYWLPRRKDFNVHKWRAPCKCNHNHEEHQANYPLRCTKCTNCSGFRAYFACISCDGAWEEHEILYETEMDRQRLGKNIRDAYKPLSAHGAIQHEVFEVKDRPVDPALARPRQGAIGAPKQIPQMPMFKVNPAQLSIGPDGKKVFQAPSSQFTFFDSDEQRMDAISKLNKDQFKPAYDDIPVGKSSSNASTSGEAKMGFKPVYDDMPVGRSSNASSAKTGFNPVFDDIPVGRPSQQGSMGSGGAKMGFNPVYDDDKYASKPSTTVTKAPVTKPAAGKTTSTVTGKIGSTTTTGVTKTSGIGAGKSTTTATKYK